MELAGSDRLVLIQDVIVLAFAGILVAMLDQQPVGALAAAITVVAYAHQHPASVQLIAMKGKFQIALLEATLGVI